MALLEGKGMEIEVEKWLSTPLLDERLKVQLENATMNEKEEIFAENVAFGTGGMRGLIGPGPNRINQLTIGQATCGFGKSLKNKFNGEHCTVVIGYDNRHFSEDFAQVAAEILSAQGIKVLLAKHLTATPIVSYAIRKYQAQGGIMITASHNPPEYNGFKIYDQTGCQYLPAEIKDVAKEITAVYGVFDFDRNSENVQFLEETIEDVYVKEFEKYISNTPKKISIGYSGQHGTGSIPVKKMFGYYQFNGLKVVKEQETADPDFSNTNSPNPEDPHAFEKLIELGKQDALDLLLTTDPDADRMGAFYRDTTGEYIRLTGNQIGAIFTYYLIQKGFFSSTSYLVKTVVSSDLGAKIAMSHDVEVVEVLTGFKYIGDSINQQDSENFLLGYEESFGYLFNPIVRDKDGVQAALLLAEIGNNLKEENKTFSDYLDEIYQEYGYYEEDLVSIETKGLDKMAKITKLMEALKNTFIPDAVQIADYSNHELFETVKKVKTKIALPKENAIKFTFEDKSWVCVRPSGTEPKLKIYYGVASPGKMDSKERMAALGNTIEKVRQEILFKPSAV